MENTTIIASLYVLFNTICIIAYLPQIRQLFISKEARKHVVLSMWGTWSLGAIIELLYALQINNLPWIWMASGHLIASVLVSILGIYGKFEDKNESLKLEINKS